MDKLTFLTMQMSCPEQHGLLIAMGHYIVSLCPGYCSTDWFDNSASSKRGERITNVEHMLAGEGARCMWCTGPLGTNRPE